MFYKGAIRLAIEEALAKQGYDVEGAPGPLIVTSSWRGPRDR